MQPFYHLPIVGSSLLLRELVQKTAGRLVSIVVYMARNGLENIATVSCEPATFFHNHTDKQTFLICWQTSA